jgi:hypothetical protein
MTSDPSDLNITTNGNFLADVLLLVLKPGLRSLQLIYLFIWQLSEQLVQILELIVLQMGIYPNFCNV